jgi:hypothetical protein
VIWRVLFLAVVFHCAGCRNGPENESEVLNSNMPRRDINLVLQEHDDQLLAIPGVVGVFAGLLEDGKTQCLRVMADRKTRELERTIPKSLEGYPVVLEETGPIRPLQ